ncbi:hypothetical protein JTE90_028656 [Oedothorax gibbosus]|uniref:Uncharacterized protein n=1 Tax=Oedothorax gibbosus TaxID=931172 RepID=A0AAV6UZW4_9ARAC|nr:hypothetical protein JTE90_028656 [Oedothorax gibbosus]
MDLVRNSKSGGVSSPSNVEFCAVGGGVFNGSRVEQAVDAFMDRLGGRLGELEVELRYAWRAVDLLSQEYVKMWEKLERLEILLYEQQNVIAQLLQVIRNGGEDTEDLMASSVTSDAERFLVKHSSGGPESSDGGDIFPSSTDLGGGRYGSETTSEWGSQGGSPAYFHPDLLQYPRREVFTASDYKRYRGGSPCISERDLEELDRLSANLQRATIARDAVYRTLNSIRNSPLRTRSEVPEAGGGFDPESLAQFRHSNYDDFSKASNVETSLTTLDPDVLLYTPDSSLDTKDPGYARAGTSWSETPSPSRSLGLAYGSSGYASNIQIIPPVPPERGCVASDYATDPSFLGHTLEERQKGHALTPVTEISPEYATSDTANNGDRSPAHLKLENVVDVTASPLSPSHQPRTTTAEIHVSDKVRTSSKSPHSEISKHKSKSSTETTSKDKPRRVKELPRIPYQPCRIKKTELLTRTEPINKKGSNSTYPPQKNKRQSKSSSPAPTRRKLPQPYIDKEGKITYDRSQGVKPATSVQYTHTLPKVPPVKESLHISKHKYDTEPDSTALTQLDYKNNTDSDSYDAEGYVTELSPEQNMSAKCSTENQNASRGYENVPKKPSYVEETYEQTYQTLPSESNTYSSTYYPQETDQPSYVAETYIEHKVDYQSSSTYIDPNSSIETENYDWNQKTDQSWCETQQTNDQYPYGSEQANIATSDYQSYKEPTVDEYGNVAYDTGLATYGDNQYNQADQPYLDYGNEIKDTQYKDTQNYEQTSYGYPSEVPTYDNYEESGQVDYSGYHENQSAQNEPPPTAYYEQSEESYKEGYTQQQVEPQDIPPEKPLREHERAAKNERFSSSPQHKGYSPQNSRNSKRRQRQYSDPVTSSCAILSQTPVTNSITPSTKQLSNSATSVAEDTSATSSGILSVLSSTVSKGYKMMSMPTLSKKETKPPVSSSNTAAASSKSGSMTSLFNIGMDTFKIGSKSKSRSNSVKSESELSVYEEPQPVVDIQDHSVQPLPEPFPSQISAEEDQEVFEEPIGEVLPNSEYPDYSEPAYPEQVEEQYQDHSQESYPPPQQSIEEDYPEDYKPPVDYHGQRRRSFQEVKHATIYQDDTPDEFPEDEFQDTSEYPDDYYEAQAGENDEYMQEEDDLVGERTVTFAEETLADKQRRKKSIATEEFASLFQTVSKSSPKHTPNRTAEDSLESGVLTDESATAVSDSRQDSLASQSIEDYGSAESVVRKIRTTDGTGTGLSEEDGSLESYGDRGRNGSEETEEITEGEGAAAAAGGKKGKKVQFESRSPSVGGGETDTEDVGEEGAKVEDDLEAMPEKTKKIIASTKSKWMKLARLEYSELYHYLNNRNAAFVGRREPNFTVDLHLSTLLQNTVESSALVMDLH